MAAVAERPQSRMRELTAKGLAAWYAYTLAYAVLVLALALVPFFPDVIIMSVGLLAHPFFLAEWVATPGAAVALGFQSRWWTVPTVLVVGTPLVALCTALTPVIDAGSEYLHVPVPWLAMPRRSWPGILDVIGQRLLWWGALFFASLACGRLSRVVRPVASDGA